MKKEDLIKRTRAFAIVNALLIQDLPYSIINKRGK